MSERLGSYELLRHLATGGMAEIFVARRSDHPEGEEIAIKCILPHLAREERFISMFLDEARIAARLQHPNIVEIYELGEEDGEYFIAMEFIEGGDLADLLDRAEERRVELPIAMSIRIIADVLAALDYAHEYAEDGRPMKIVHRDVSPHNVLIGTNGKIKLVDFGIAHAAERHAKTETGLVKGKLSYMAPEQVEQRGVDRRADIFSAGALLYELLIGEPPFGRDLFAINAILNDDPPNPQIRRPDVPDELVDVLFRALEKEPEDRYDRASDMLDALEGVLAVFDKQVDPTEVAAFAAALITGEPIAYYDDVSQSIPRVMTEDLGKWTTDVEAVPPSLRAEELPTLPRADEVLAPVVAAPPLEEAPSPARYFAAAAAGLVLIGGAVAVIGATSAADTPKLEVQLPPISEADVGEVAVIELDDQYVDFGTPEEWDEPGFTFDEDELELTQLERWVATLEPAQVDQMLALNFDRSDADYLWSVRAPGLATSVLGPREPVNPGDPDAPALLGLEGLDDAVLKLKPKSQRKRTIRGRSRRSTNSKRVPDPVVETKAKPKPKPKPRPRAKKTTKKRKNDLRIIDKAVPY